MRLTTFLGTVLLLCASLERAIVFSRECKRERHCSHSLKCCSRSCFITESISSSMYPDSNSNISSQSNLSIIRPHLTLSPLLLKYSESFSLRYNLLLCVLVFTADAEIDKMLETSAMGIPSISRSINTALYFGGETLSLSPLSLVTLAVSGGW